MVETNDFPKIYKHYKYKKKLYVSCSFRSNFKKLR